MNYLTVRPQSVNAGGKHNLTEIRIVGEGATVDHSHCEVWALASGNQVLDVYGQLVRKMKNFHMAGNFDNGAVYVMDYDDVVRVCTTLLGPSDKVRCRMLEDMAAANQRVAGQERARRTTMIVTDVLTGVLQIMWTIVAGIGKVIFSLLITMLLMRWMRGRRHRR